LTATCSLRTALKARQAPVRPRDRQDLLKAATRTVSSAAPFVDREKLTIISGCAYLSMDSGAKVTYNGVEIGRVCMVEAF
jgi:hypothetical protein